MSNRLNCVQVWIDKETFILLFNVYMPCDEGIMGEHLREYQDVLYCEGFDYPTLLTYLSVSYSVYLILFYSLLSLTLA